MNAAYWKMMYALNYDNTNNADVQQMILKSAEDTGVFIRYPVEATEANLEFLE